MDAIREAFRTRSRDWRKKNCASSPNGEIAHYFLTVHDIVQFARSAGTSFARAAARPPIPRSVMRWASPPSIPTKFDVLFERFLNTERREPPDIDVDFEHERREEVIQYIYRPLWPSPRRADRHRDLLSPAQRHPRSGQGVRPDRRRHRQAGRYGLGPSWRRAERTSGAPGRQRSRQCA